MSAPLDLDAIDPGWTQPCGPCDLGVPTSCSCPTGDPRIVISQLVTEVERLRAANEHREQRVAALREAAGLLDRRSVAVSDTGRDAADILRERADRIEQP